MSEDESDWLQFSDSEQDELNTKAEKQEKQEIEKLQQNLHCQQYVLINKKEPPQLGEFKEENMFLTEEFPQREYHRRAREPKTVYCSLFLSELYPIIYLIIQNPTIKHIVFNKAAQNITIHSLLTKLFPNITQHILEIFGKSPLNGIQNVNLYNFSPIDPKFGLIKEKIGQEFLFVYTLQQTKFSDLSDMNFVIEDAIQKQQEVVKLIQPTMSLLSFQLPYTADTVKFFKGKIMLPVCQSATSTICKIFVSRNNIQNIVQFDCKKYEKQLFYHNTEYRVSCFNNQQQLTQFDQCFDCSIIQYINNLYREYLSKYDKKEMKNGEIAQMIISSVPRRQNQQQYVRFQDRKN